VASCSSRGVALVTGYHGFTGGYLARRLEGAGYRVVGLVRRRPEVSEASGASVASGASAPVVVADLGSLEQSVEAVAQAEPEVVVHLAGVSFVDHANAADFHKANVLGTQNLLEALALLKRPPRAVLLASSANVYGNAPQEVLDETVPPQPANDYAASKLAMEGLARTWMDRLPITLVRPFNYTGVGQSLAFVLPKLVDHFRRGAPEIALGNTEVWRDFSDVRTVAEAYQRLADKAPAGEVVNICSGSGHSLAQVLGMLAEIAGYAITVKTDPALVRKSEVRRLVGSPEKLRRLIGPLPSIPLFETLRWMFEARS